MWCAALFGTGVPRGVELARCRKLSGFEGACRASVSRGEAELAPRTTVDDLNAMEDVLRCHPALAQLHFVEEESLRGGVGEEQAEGLALDDEIEAHLSGALGSEPAVGAHAVAIRDRSEAVE